MVQYVGLCIKIDRYCYFQIESILFMIMNVFFHKVFVFISLQVECIIKLSDNSTQENIRDY